MESEKTIFFGLEVKPRFNEKVSVPLHHSFTCSITGAGKSVTERTLISRTEAKFLIIDCKTPRDYEGLGPDIPIFIDNRSDPLMIKRLLESSSRLWLRKEFPELIELCKVGKTWEGVLEATRQKMKWTNPKTGRGVHPVVKERLVVLEHLLGRLIDEMKPIKMADALELPHNINVMDIHGLSLGLQQLIVHSILTKVLNKFTNVVVVIDEAHRFCPERKPSAARDAVTLLIQEGRAKNDFVWMSDQTVTGVDKDVLKQMHVWILGCQTEKNEADRTLDQLTHDMGLKRRDIYRLKTGHFLVNTREWTKLAYLVPEGMDLSLAEEVISGRIKPEHAFARLEKAKEVEEELVWKEKFEEEHRIRKTLEKTLAQYTEDLNNLRKKLVEQKSPKEIEELRKTITQLKDEKANLEKQLEEEAKAFVEVEKKADAFENLQKALAPFLPTSTLTSPELEPKAPSLSLADVDERINQRIASGEVKVVQVNVSERVKELIREDFLRDVAEKIRGLPDLAKRAARYIHEKGTVGTGELYFFLYQKKAVTREFGVLRMNVTKPLEKAGLVAYDKKGEVRWAMDERLLDRFKGLISESDVQSMRNYLLSLIL